MASPPKETDRKFRVAVFDAKSYDKEYLTAQNEAVGSACEMKFFQAQLGLDTVELCRGFDALCLFVNDTCDAAVIDRAAEHGIQLIMMRCAGYDRVDLEAAAEAGISVTRVPAYSPYAVAEFAVSLLCCLNRRIHIAYNRIRDGNFSLVGLDGIDIHGKTCGVVGTGKIGQCFMDIMIGFGCKILATDEYVNETYAAKPEVTYVTKEELFKQSDIISLHLPLFPSTKHLINKESLALMKPTAILVNTSRGGLVDASALVDALKFERIGGAALDVYEEEEGYFFEDKSADVIRDDTLARLQNMRNCIITSHQAFFTKEALIAISKTSINNAVEYCQGKRFHELTNYVAPPGWAPDDVRFRNRGMSYGEERDFAMMRLRTRKNSLGASGDEKTSPTP